MFFICYLNIVLDLALPVTRYKYVHLMELGKPMDIVDYPELDWAIIIWPLLSNCCLLNLGSFSLCCFIIVVQEPCCVIALPTLALVCRGLFREAGALLTSIFPIALVNGVPSKDPIVT